MRLRRDRASAIRLERQVRDRTKALSDSNASLRQAQSELVQSAKLAALGQMSATLSHEYNQPLAAIRTYADNARLLIERGRTGPADEAIGHIAGLVDRMSELSRTLLGFARRPGVTVQPVNLGAVVDEALLLAGPRAKKAGVAVRKQGFDETVTVMGGRVRLTQVVVNLVNNAVDALTGVGAAIAIADPEIVISAEREEDGVTLTISDNGPGIAAENRERVFEPFFSTKAAGEGIGIGLSIVYTILKDLGASIEVGSGPAGGAAFVIRLKTQEGDRQT